MIGLPTGIFAVAVSGGGAHSIVLGSDGIAYSTGSNAYGQLGDYFNNTSGRSTLAPMLGLPTGVQATSVSARTGHTLVLGSDGSPTPPGATVWVSSGWCSIGAAWATATT